MAWIVPRRGLRRSEGSRAASGAAMARLDTRTEVWTTFLASSNGPGKRGSYYEYAYGFSASADGFLQASGEVTSPARRPAPVKVRIPATVGLLPGFLYSSNGDSPVIL